MRIMPAPRDILRKAINEMLAQNVGDLISALKNSRQEKDNDLIWFAEQLHSAKSSPELLRELFRKWVIKPEKDAITLRVSALRNFFGWKIEAQDFNDLLPEFLDVIYLLPPRSYAVEETLLPLFEQLEEIPQPDESKQLLDIGTGTGLLMRILRKAGLRGKMLGIDSSTAMTNFALQKFKDCSEEVTINTLQIQDFSDKASFQTALCYMVLHHVSDYQSALDNIFNALTEGGVFIYTDKVCAKLAKTDKLKAFDFKTTHDMLRLESGLELVVEQSKLNTVSPFQPHPKDIPEYDRQWQDVAKILSKTGFLIQFAKPLNERVMLYVCRKPKDGIWNRFIAEPDKLEFYNFFKDFSVKVEMEGHAPYQWTFDVLKILYKDITERECPTKKTGEGFLKGIAYFSWEESSRLFLVRRAVPFDFHILSYSHVHEGWGALGRMVEDFEYDPSNYVNNIGYTCLTQDVVQRTLPFESDIDYLEYEAAMAVPVYNSDPDIGPQLRGAFLFYLAKPEHIPFHTGRNTGLISRFKSLSELMSAALDEQKKRLYTQHEEAPEIPQPTKTIFEKWEKLAKKKSNVVIAKLKITKHKKKSGGEISKIEARQLSRVCSKIQAKLSGNDCHSVLDDRKLKKGEAIILVAARYGLSYDKIREKILAVIGDAAVDFKYFFYSCTRLGHENQTTQIARRRN